MFSIGDTVLYGAQGVCRISDIALKQFGKEFKKYYVLNPVYQDTTTIFVPVDSEKLTSRMHAVLSAQEIKELISAMPYESELYIEDDLKRRQQFREIISSGDRKAISSVIKTLYLEQCRRKEQNRKLPLADEQLLERAESILYNELALVLNIKPEQVIPFLNENIGIEEL